MSDKMPRIPELEERVTKAARPSASTTSEEMAQAVNLMAHPVAAMAAGSAMGLAAASHAFGIWMGAMAGSIEASQRMMGFEPDGGADAFRSAQPSAARIRAAADTIIADAERTARETMTAVRKVNRAVESDVAKVARVVAKERKVSRPATSKTIAKDDLKAISGVGPKLEQVLNELGVATYAQIAAWTDAEVARIEDEIGFNGRVTRDDWIGQAKKLGGKA